MRPSGGGRSLDGRSTHPLAGRSSSPYHEPKGGYSWDCVRDICSGQQRSVHTMSGRPMAAHRVKFLILFTYAVRKFFWFPPPKARDLMPISHTPLEPFVDNDAFTIIDSNTCTKIPVSVYGSSMCFHCMVSRKRMKPQRSVLLQLDTFSCYHHLHNPKLFIVKKKQTLEENRKN